jgi:hypothetical protein
MNENKRPLSVTGMAWLFIVVGAVTFVYHFPNLRALHTEDLWIELTELLAFVAGAFMLRGHNWARWLALAWMGFHVAISAFPPFKGLVVHCIIFAGIAWLLLRSDSAQYFRGDGGAVC